MLNFDNKLNYAYKKVARSSHLIIGTNILHISFSQIFLRKKSNTSQRKNHHSNKQQIVYHDKPSQTCFQSAEWASHVLVI